MKKLKLLIIFIGIIFISLPYFFNTYSIFRIISSILGIIIITLVLLYKQKRIYIKIPILAIVFFLGVYILDYIMYQTLNIMPVLVWQKESSSKVKTYNSFTYRIYDCDGKFTFDDGYKKVYSCDESFLDVVSINKFLENPKESYKEYKGKFIHLDGKINTIVGNSALSLNSYDLGENYLNGYVVFDEEKKVTIKELDINPKDFYIYDYIEVIGRVAGYKEKDAKKEIILKDAVIAENNIYKNPEITVNEDYTNSVTKIADNLYYAGILNIFYRYDEENIYEFNYLLLDKRESIDNLIDDVEPVDINEDGDKLYKLDNYQVLKCHNEIDVLVSNRFHYYEGLCDKNEN